jgi:hypothetical protein
LALAAAARVSFGVAMGKVYRKIGKIARAVGTTVI